MTLKITVSAAAIGLSNYLVQLFTKNKLADVSIMGINTFQQLVVAIFILFFTNFFLSHEQSFIFSFIYLLISVLSGGFFYVIAQHNKLSSKNIFIYGILTNILITALAYFLLTSNVTNQDIIKIRFSYYQNKIFGGLVLVNDFSNIYLTIILLVICLIWTFCLRLKLMALNSLTNKTSTLGFKNKLIKFNLILLVSILGSIVFGLIGIVAFVGVSVSFITNKIFCNFNYSVFGSMLIAIIFMLISQYIQITISYFASPISLTTISGFVSCLIFLGFLIFRG